MGPGKDTHGTPVPNSGKAVGGDQEISQSAAAHRHVMQKLFNRVKSPNTLTKPKTLTTTNTTDEHKRSMRESDDEFDKSAKNDFINQERGKFDEVSITNDKIVEKRASRASKIVDEDAVEKDEAVRSAMSRRLCRIRIRSSRRVNQVNAQRQRQSRFRVSGVQEFEFHRVKPEQDQNFEVSTGDTRSDLRCRQQR